MKSGSVWASSALSRSMTAAGSCPSVAYARRALRACAMRAAERRSWPMTSPMTTPSAPGRQHQQVVPVAADLRARAGRLVAHGDGDVVAVGQAARQQAALQLQRAAPLALRVVGRLAEHLRQPAVGQRHVGVRGHGLEQPQVLRAEGAGAAPVAEQQHAGGLRVGADRGHHHLVQAAALGSGDRRVQRQDLGLLQRHAAVQQGVDGADVGRWPTTGPPPRSRPRAGCARRRRTARTEATSARKVRQALRSSEPIADGRSGAASRIRADSYRNSRLSCSCRCRT